MHEPQAFVDLQDAGNAQAQLILQAIARHADWDTGEGYPKQETIARMAKCCERTVRSYVKKLEADGFIEVVERRRDDGGRASNIIRLVGYADWISANRNGGKVAAPKAAKRYEQPPGKNCHGGEAKDTAPPGNIPAGAPGNMLAAQEHSLNDQIILSAQAREDSKSDLKVQGRALPSHTITANDPQWEHWIVHLRKLGRDDLALRATAAGSITTVGSRWPKDGCPLPIVKPVAGLTEQSKRIANSGG
jgi:hypothetical protein